MTGPEWGAIVALVLGILAGVGWMLGRVAEESNTRRQEDAALQRRIDELERRHATKDDIEHLNRSIDRLHKSVENLTTLVKNGNGS